MTGDILDQIWDKLTECNPACSCCSGDDEYLDRVNQVGAMIDGRQWERRYVSGAGWAYETVPGGAS